MYKPLGIINFISFFSVSSVYPSTEFNSPVLSVWSGHSHHDLCCIHFYFYFLWGGSCFLLRRSERARRLILGGSGGLCGGMAQIGHPKGRDLGPILTLGDRVVWLFEHGPEHGWVRWVGRIPVVSPNWSIGVEFDNPVGAGDGKFGGKRYFYARNDHAYFLPSSSLIRSQDYNSSYEKNRIDIGNPVGSQSKTSTFPYIHSTTQHPFVDAGIASSLLTCHHCHNAGYRRCGVQTDIGFAKKVDHCKSATMKSKGHNEELSDSENWLDKNSKNVCVQSWKSSSTHSIVSCPSVLLPQVVVAQEVSSSSDSGLELGSLRSFMACFTVRGHRRKARKRKKQKLVLAASQNSSCSVSSARHSKYDLPNKDKRQDYVASLPYAFSDKIEQQDTVTQKSRTWDTPLQKPNVCITDDVAKKIESQKSAQDVLMADIKEQTMNLPKIPLKAIVRKKRPAPQPPVRVGKEYASLSLGTRGVASTRSSLHWMQTPPSSLRRSNKKPAPQPPIASTWNAKDTASEKEETSKYGNAAIQPDTSRNGIPLSASAEGSSHSGVSAATQELRRVQILQPSLPEKMLTSFNGIDTNHNTADSLSKPELPSKAVIPMTTPQVHGMFGSRSSTSKITSSSVMHNDDQPVAIDSGSAEAQTNVGDLNTFPPHCSPPGLAKPVKRDTRSDMERLGRCITTTKAAVCSTIIEEEETYGTNDAVSTGDQLNDLEAILKQNSNVLELLDAFSKLEVSTTMDGNSNDLGSPKKHRKQLKPLKSLFQKHPFESSKVVSTKWIYTPMEASSEWLTTDGQSKGMVHADLCLQSGPTECKEEMSVEKVEACDDSRVEENIFNVPVRSLQLKKKVTNEALPLQEELAVDLAICQKNVKPAGILPGLGRPVTHVAPAKKEDKQLTVIPMASTASGMKAMLFKQGGSSNNLAQEIQNSIPVEVEEMGKRETPSLSGCSAQSTALPSAMYATPALPKEPVKKTSAELSPAVSSQSSPRTDCGNVRPPAHPNSPTASMHARVSLLFRQLEEAISKGEHEKAAMLARELAMCKVSCSMRRINKTPADPKQLVVKMYVEDKQSHVGPISIHVHPGMTLRHLKKKIEAEYAFPAKVQRWILGKNLAMDDASTLEQHGVCHSDCPVFLYLVSPAERQEDDLGDSGTSASPMMLPKAHTFSPVVSKGITEASCTDQAPLLGLAQADPQLDRASHSRKVSNSSSALDALLNGHAAGWTCGLCGIRNVEAGSCAMCGAVIAPKEHAEYDDVPRNDVPRNDVPQNDVPQNDVPQNDVPQNDVPQNDVPQNATFEADISEDDALQHDAQQGRVPQDSVLQDNSPEPKESLEVKNLPQKQEENLLPEAALPKDYLKLIELDEQDLVPNAEMFECPVCFIDTEPMEGAVLRDCLHSFCKDCLCNAIRYAEGALVKCPFRNDEYSCDSHLQEREVKALVPPDVYEHHLHRSMKAAESQAPNSFHCKSPDCPGWCVLEDNVNVFLCPVCGHTNCLTCRAIHDGKNCLQYQDELEYNAPDSQEAKKTKEYLDDMVEQGQAMHCPQCQVIVMKKWGCDWLKCSVCQTEICWVTKGPRWGPNGKGDVSAGCKCGVNGVKCHPKCNYCH